MKILQKLFGLVLVAFLIAPIAVFADSYYGTGSNGLDPYGSGSNGLNPYGTGSNGLNPYGLGSNGLNPYGAGSNGLNPYGTGSNGLNPYGSGTTTTGTGSGPTTQPPTGPNPNPSPGPTGGTIWGSLSGQTIPEDSPTGTIVYSGLKSLCFDNNGVNMQVTTTSPNFDLVFRNNDLVLNRLTANFNGAEVVGLSCNGRANSFVLTVSPVNDAPVFTSTPVTSARKNNLYSYDANAADVEGNAITFALITSPAGMTIDSNSGVVSWTANQIGGFTVQIRATDSNGASANQAYVISVSSGGGGGSSGGSSGTSEKHSLEIANVDLDNNFVCGDNFKAVVSLVNTGKFSEAASVKIENEGLKISESKSTSVTKGSSKDIEFTFNIPEGANGDYTLVTKLTYPDGSDFEYKTISVTCEEKKEIEKVITTSEDKGKERNLGMIITLILAILAAGALVVWFVLLLRDEFMTTERFI